ncbi:type IX secretion/gliding motility protein PorT/SprT [Ferruginibacter albus]|uniref:type IX secretion/gliding motility protein PorT/SprT n=1 Tax=Ferruginibacter albus TaxID=2875540 RepID=UPI001CC4C89A|nr:porin family protein [Ferruginibacter albus]UAY52498.1 PorT family protein [Ferruginibacter albus]
MRRKIIYIALLLACPVMGFSQLFQELNQQEFDQKILHFGINVGFNQSHFNFTHHDQFLTQDSVMDIESINSTGINLAWLVNYKISDHFDFRTYPLDLTFSERAFQYALKYPDAINDETPITTKKVQSIALSLPVTIKFTSDRIGNLKVYTIAGARLDYDLAASASSDRNVDAIIKLNKFGYGLEGGIGFHLYFPYFVLSPELKFDWGLANLHNRNANNKYSNNIDKIYARMVSFSLTIE